MDKEILGYLSLLTAFISYVLYFRSVLKGKTRPHAFSWFIWGILTSIAFAAQYANGAGAGAWATCFVALYCFTVAVLAVFMGEKDIKKSDYITFSLALMILPLWYLMHDALTAVIMIILIDALGGYYPTFRKSWHKPGEETLTLYIISIFQLLLSLLAMQNYALVNILYPVFIILANSAFAAMVWLRRKIVTIS